MNPDQPTVEKTVSISPYDEETIPDKFITPHSASGENTHELKAGAFNITVSFERENGQFGLSGVLDETGKGVIVSGRISGGIAKVNHLFLDETLRNSLGHFEGIANALVIDLEGQLREVGVTHIYSAFVNTGTVKFLLKNGYKIISVAELGEDIRRNLRFNVEDFDRRINNEYDFMKMGEREDPRQALLVKEV